MGRKKGTLCLEDSQVKRLAHDSFMMGKHGSKAEDVCPTVEEIVKEATTTEERLGKQKKKKGEESLIDGVSKKAQRNIVKGIKSKLGALGDFF